MAAQPGEPENSGERASRATGKPRGRQFQPGQSGNPGGRPKGVNEAKHAAAAKAVAMIETLEQIALDPKAAAVARVRAAEIILDRALGRPEQPVGIEGGVTLRIEVPTE